MCKETYQERLNALLVVGSHEFLNSASQVSVCSSVSLLRRISLFPADRTWLGRRLLRWSLGMTFPPHIMGFWQLLQVLTTNN
jgi:hypothetical protein